MKNSHYLPLVYYRVWIQFYHRAFGICFLVSIGQAKLFTISCYSDLVSWNEKKVGKWIYLRKR